MVLAIGRKAILKMKHPPWVRNRRTGKIHESPAKCCAPARRISDGNLEIVEGDPPPGSSFCEFCMAEFAK